MSASAPSFAGVMALVAQHTAARQGNANTALYSLASKQRAGGASVFHDVLKGNNSVPGQAGFTATIGYDQVTGLGSIDGSVLVNHWSDAKVVPAFQATPSANSLSVTAGSNNSIKLNVTVSGGFDAAVAFSEVKGLRASLEGQPRAAVPTSAYLSPPRHPLPTWCISSSQRGAEVDAS